jgi:PPP family 3-phenylpropionic acid transporter
MSAVETGGQGRKLAVGSAAHSFGLRLAAFYAALFVIYGIHLPYLPVWLDKRGLSAEEIATITAAPFFLRAFITPTVAMLADRTARHRALINALAWLTLVLALLLSQMQSFWAIFLLAVPFSITLSTIMPLTETIAVAGVRAHGLDYGRMRLWGSLTFVTAGFVGGWLIDHTGATAVLACLIAGTVATVATAWLLPEKIERAPAADPAAGTDPAGTLSHQAPMRGGSIEEAWKLVSSPVFLAFLLAAGAAQGSHGMVYTFGALTWRAEGISTAWVGALWAIAIGGEVLLFAYSGRVVRRWGPVALLIGATTAAIVRWITMTLSPPLIGLIPLQVLHTLTYGASHLGAMHFIARAVPESAQGTAQALYATVASGLLMGTATLTSGWLYGKVGALAYLAMAALATAGFAGALYVGARWQGGLLWTGTTATPRP